MEGGLLIQGPGECWGGLGSLGEFLFMGPPALTIDMSLRAAVEGS